MERLCAFAMVSTSWLVCAFVSQRVWLVHFLGQVSFQSADLLSRKSRYVKCALALPSASCAVDRGKVALPSLLTVTHHSLLIGFILDLCVTALVAEVDEGASRYGSWLLAILILLSAYVSSLCALQVHARVRRC